MKRTISVFLIVPLLLSGAFFGTAHLSAETEAEAFSMLVPIAFYTSDTGFAGGGLFQRFYPSGVKVSIAGFYTQKQQINVFYSSSYFTPESPWWLQYGGSGKYYPEYFYGTGGETLIDNEEQYTSVGIKQYLNLYSRLFDGLYAGPAFQYQWVDIIDPETGGLIDQNSVTGSEGYQIVYSGMGIGTGREPIMLDSFTGFSYEATLTYARTIQGDQTEGGLFDSDFRFFYNLGRFSPRLIEHQLAFQQISRLSGGDLPFAELPSLGGGDILRGYAADRFRDSSALLLQGDYRFPLYKRFKGALFTGIGNVAPKLNEIGDSDLKLAWGGGLRFQAGPTPDTSFRLDFGMTDEGYGIYFLFGEAF